MSVVAELAFTGATGASSFVYLYPRDDGGPQASPSRRDLRTVTITDARPRAAQLSFDLNGVCLVGGVATRLTAEDFYAPPIASLIPSIYYTDVAKLVVSRLPGCLKAVPFDHNVRNSHRAREAQQAGQDVSHHPAVTGYAKSAHNDFTLESARRRLLDVAAAGGCDLTVGEAEAYASGAGGRRFAVLSVWRSLDADHPVQRWPLAVCDGATMSAGDTVDQELRYRDFTGHLYQVRYSPQQRWLYFPRLTSSEAIFVKTFDSAGDPSFAAGCVVPFTSHTAFDVPGSEDAPPRQSCEVRAFAFFGAPGEGHRLHPPSRL